MSYEELVESRKHIGDMTKEELFIYCQGLLEEVWSFENENIRLHSIIKEVRERCNYLLENNEVQINGKIYLKQEADDFITNYILEILDKAGSDRE